MMLQSIRLPCTIKPVKTRNVKTRIKCSSGSDYSDQTFDDVDTVLIKYISCIIMNYMKNFYYYNKSKKKWSKKFSDFFHKLISN